METFQTVGNQMLFLFICMLIGYILHKVHDIPEEADIIISKLENHVFTPALIINSFRVNCTIGNLKENAHLILYCLLVIGISVPLSFLLAPRFTDDKRDYGIYRYAIAMSNFGFMGNSLVLSILGDLSLFHYLMFCIPASIFTYTAAPVWLSGGKRKFRPRSLINPMFLSMLVGIVLGLTACPLPSFITSTTSSLAQCYSPMAMLLTGFVVARYDLKELFSEKKIYVLSLLRGIIIPLFFYGLCRVLKLPMEPAMLIMIFTAMPIGLNTIVFPAAYGGNEHPGAAMALISNLLGLVTVPLMLSLVL